MVNGAAGGAMLHAPPVPFPDNGHGTTERSAPLSSRSMTAARFVPAAVLLLGLGLFFAFGLGDYLSCGSLRDNRVWLLDWVGAIGRSRSPPSWRSMRRRSRSRCRAALP